ncbi:MAG: hypothetical protein IKV00_09325 [Clostridia bacterium]|nr:hypothetical protein [Clostridia bacterium]
MNLSLKNMLVSFAVALILLSVIMTVVCVSVFRGRVDEGLVPSGGLQADGLPDRRTVYDFSDAAVYYAEKNGAVSLAALVCISDAERVVTVTVLDKSLPVRYKNGIYFISSICEEEGKDALLDVASALTGMEPVSLLASTENDVSSSSASSFLASLSSLYEGRGYEVKRMDVITDRDGVADHKATMEQFFVTKK